MTDVIGRGDVDAPVRSRLWRPPRWLTWLVIVFVGAGVLGVPAARSKLADRAAGWLQAQWATRSSYDDARAAVIDTVARRAGVADEAIVEQASAKADRDEATALAALTGRLRAHHTWAPDVARARDAMVGALQLEVRMLRLDAGSKQPTTGYLLAAPVDGLVRAASARMSQVARRRHLSPPRHVPVRLPVDQAALHRLATTTDIATGLSVVMVGPERPLVIDLDSGRVTTMPVGRAAGLASWDGRTVVLHRHQVDLFDTQARVTARISATDTQLLSTTGNAIWLQGPLGVRRYDVTGRPLSRWLVPPDHLSAAAATGASVVLVDAADPAVRAQVWNTTTGARQPVPVACGWGTSTNRVVAVPCPEQRAVYSVNLADGAPHRLRLPRRVAGTTGEMTDPLSPHGDELAVVLEHHGDEQVGAIDLRTGRLRESPLDPTVEPVAWSTDGQWLLLVDTNSFRGGQLPRVALWRPADGRVTSVRLPDAAVLGVGVQAVTLSTSGSQR